MAERAALAARRGGSMSPAARARGKAGAPRRKAGAPPPAPTGARRAARSRATPLVPKIVVLRAPGTNCDVETGFAFAQAGALAVPIHAGRRLARRALPA